MMDFDGTNNISHRTQPQIFTLVKNLWMCDAVANNLQKKK